MPTGRNGPAAAVVNSTLYVIEVFSSQPLGTNEAFTPFAAQIQPPINADGSSVFSVKRGVVPVKFTLTSDGAPTCQLPPATISLARTAGAVLGSIDESIFVRGYGCLLPHRQHKLSIRVQLGLRFTWARHILGSDQHRQLSRGKWHIRSEVGQGRRESSWREGTVRDGRFPTKWMNILGASLGRRGLARALLKHLHGRFTPPPLSPAAPAYQHTSAPEGPMPPPADSAWPAPAPTSPAFSH